MIARVLAIQPIKQFSVDIKIIAWIYDLICFYVLVSSFHIHNLKNNNNKDLWEIFIKVWNDSAKRKKKVVASEDS